MNNVTEKYALDQKRKLTSEEFSKNNLDENVYLLVQSEIFNLNDNSHYDFNFGNTIWNIDFDLFKIQGEWEKNFGQIIHTKIADNIDVLQDIEVKINKSEVSASFQYIKYPVIKFYLDIHITAMHTVTREEYYFHTCLFLSPM